MAKATVKGPTLPTNIVRIINIFPKLLRCGVIPVDKPTVPNAEVTSKRIFKKKFDSPPARRPSATTRSIVKTTIQAKPKKKTVKTLLTMLFGMVLPKIETWGLFLNIDQKTARIIPKVTVFIPPPVDPGEAPINIKIIIKKSVGVASLPMGKVLNPAVLGVTA